MRKFTIPPLSGIEPVVNIKQTENGMTAEISYTAEAIDEMVRRANEVLDDELMKRLAEQHGYVKERTCHIEEYDEAPYSVCSECGAIQPEDFTVYYCWNCGCEVVSHEE